MRERQITVAARFCGPPGIGNGGYVSGTLAAGLAAAEVTLKGPVPLERPLSVRDSGAAVALLDNDRVLAAAQPAAVTIAPPTPPAAEQVRVAAPSFLGHRDHGFPHCFGCGTARAPGDGLRLFPAPIEGQELLAAMWVPEPELGEGGRVRPEFVWTALDCPGGFAWMEDRFVPMLLGRLEGRIVAPVLAGRPHIVLAWRLGADERRRYAGTALFTIDGSLCATARATWFPVL